ncbi:hypothetical protein SELR_24870 [Selenomonas ruminantium subsp. lactilytica TAM6421]|uniref:Uncharacterized protein n=1 Tax=Selenomonas ruminantium subsp. lactilytica (strain NBRC 103574 / TAM6421) TaxID=927704 RepID=I0GTV8_SELRL|nr:hypothetical protein SELR_24870 [Selenomonas ruminantium subsp. lactilytica TAM6421]
MAGIFLLATNEYNYHKKIFGTLNHWSNSPIYIKRNDMR